MIKIGWVRMRKGSPHYIEYHIVTQEHPEGRWMYCTDIKGRKNYNPKLFQMLLPYVTEKQREAAGLAASTV